MDRLQALGEWWLPDSTTTRVAGEITFSSKDGIQLDLLGSLLGGDMFDTLAQRLRTEPQNVPVIFGLVPGWEVTLFNVSEQPTPRAYPGPQTQRLSAEHILLGGHIATGTFDRCAVRTSLLDEWAAFGGVRGPDEPHMRQITYSPQPSYQATLDDGVDLELRASAGENHSLTEHVLSIAAWWHITFPSPRSLADIEAKYIHPLQDIVSLATEQPVAVRYFEVWNSTEENPYGLKVGRQWSYAPETYPSALPLFTAASLDFQFQLPQWFQLCNKLADIRALVLSDRFLGPFTVDHLITNTAGAAEALHRATDHRDPSDLLRRMRPHIDALVEAAPEDDRTSVRSFLRHTYDPSLRQRLVELVSQIGVRSEAITGTNVSKWASTVRKLRDELTHRDGAPTRPRDWQLAYSVARGLEVWVTTRLMQLLGLQEDSIDRAWDVSTLTRSAVQLAAHYVLPVTSSQ